jgi:hypothetical protein
MHADATIVSAAAGVLGALVGAATGGVSERLAIRQRDKRQARAAARLVRADLSIAAEQLASAIGELLWWPFYKLEFESWTTYRDLLAMELSAEHWGLVSQSCTELQSLGETQILSPNWNSTGPMERSRDAADSFLKLRADAIKAHNALAPLAEEVGDMIKPQDAPAVRGTPHRLSPD